MTILFFISSSANENLKSTESPHKSDKIQTSMRVLRGHTGAVTALHCVTRREVWDLVGDREDAGFFISGSTDCTVSWWSCAINMKHYKIVEKNFVAKGIQY